MYEENKREQEKEALYIICSNSSNLLHKIVSKMRALVVLDIWMIG